MTNIECVKCKKENKNPKYPMCYHCMFRCCKDCGKRNVRSSSNYDYCYKCNQKTVRVIKKVKTR